MRADDLAGFVARAGIAAGFLDQLHIFKRCTGRLAESQEQAKFGGREIKAFAIQCSDIRGGIEV